MVEIRVNILLTCDLLSFTMQIENLLIVIHSQTTLMMNSSFGESTSDLLCKLKVSGI